MASTKQRRAPAQRPGEIIDAALALFVEKGFAATRLDDVAERAGLSKAAIYLYFEDKTALFQGVVRQAVAANLGTVEAMLTAHRGPVAELLPRILEFMAGRIEQGEFRLVDPAMTVRSIVGAMLLAGIWRTVFEPIGADKLDIKALARHHA